VLIAGGLSYLTHQELSWLSLKIISGVTRPSPDMEGMFHELLQSVLIDKHVLGTWKGTEIHLLEQ
jgi:hypothetical protein